MQISSVSSVASIVPIVVIAACGSKPARPHEVGTTGGGIVASNVLRDDYAGSTACADCHGDLYQRWMASPMHNMTRDAATAKIRAPFAGATLRVGATSATMTTEGSARIVTVTTAGGTERYRVTKVIGGRYREDFVGRLEGSGDHTERVLPATYVFHTKSWRYKGYSVMVKERPRLVVGTAWKQVCIGCHNTLPLATNYYDELYGPHAPPFQQKLSDRAVPPRFLWPAHVDDDDGLASALRREIVFLGGEPEASGAHALLGEAARTTRDRLDTDKLVELGIGCEACHNGSREHAVDPKILPSFAVRSSLFGIDPPNGEAGNRAQWINHTCAKCHTVLFTHYPWTWEGGVRRKNPGGSSTNSGEGRDFQIGGCASAMACTQCHDPHTEDPRAKLAAMATPAGNKLCASCHQAIAATVVQHSHHAAGSTGTSCVACHMPKKNMGLDYALVRYHRIGSPNDPKRVERDRPLECALCHADKSVSSLVSTMEQWWNKRYDRAKLRALYGEDLDVNAMRATLVRGKPHEQAVAIGVYGELRDRTAIPAIAPMMAHAYPLVRYYARRSLEEITGAPVDVDVNLPAAEALRDARAWLATQR